MKHIAIFNNSGDVQTALNEETLLNPYVAKVSGALDYNSLEPAPPCYLGEWSDDGEGHYTFHINDAGATAWYNGVQIGTLLGVYFNGGEEPIDMPVRMAFDGSYWTVEYVEPNESSNPNYQFVEGVQEFWDCTDITTETSSSTASVYAAWDGTDTFEFFRMAQDAPALSMTTINPECPEEGPSD